MAGTVPQLLAHMGEIGRDHMIDVLTNPAMPNERKEAMVRGWFGKVGVPYERKQIVWFLNALRRRQSEDDRKARPLRLIFLYTYIYGQTPGGWTRLSKKPSSLHDALDQTSGMRAAIVIKVSKRHQLQQDDREDLDQVAAEVVARKWTDYDPTRGATFKTWIDRVVRNALADYLELQRRRQHDRLPDPGWDEGLRDPLARGDDIATDVVERVAVDQITGIPNAELVHYRGYGYSDKKLTEWTGKSVAATRKMRQRAHMRMLRAMEK